MVTRAEGRVLPRSAAALLLAWCCLASFAAGSSESVGEAKRTEDRPAQVQARELGSNKACKSPALPLDGAPLVGLSLDQQHVNATSQTHPPPQARAGSTKLHLLVNEDGWVVRARVAASNGEPGLDAWVLGMVSEWRFKPRYLDGKAVCAWGTYSVTFQVADRDPEGQSKTDEAQRESQ